MKQCYGFYNFKSGVVERFSCRYILWIVTAELQTANIAYFQRKIQLSRYSAYPDGSPSQSIWISGVLLYVHVIARQFSKNLLGKTRYFRPHTALRLFCDFRMCVSHERPVHDYKRKTRMQSRSWSFAEQSTAYFSYSSPNIPHEISESWQLVCAFEQFIFI
jgi:hypothetical protein